jgi:2,3-dihydroxybiphenyl 1,2-dioxygenase
MSHTEDDGSALLTSRRELLGLGAAAALSTLGGKAWATVGSSPSRGLQSLGYMVVPGQDLDAWSLWAPKVMGLQLSDHSATTRVFRMDDYQHRFAIDQGAQTPTYGWEVADGRAMDAMAAGLEAAGVRVTRGSRSLAGQRAVKDLLTFSDPAGNSVEIFHGPARASAPFQPARRMGGFRTGSLGMGHVAVVVPSAYYEATSRFYRELLGFRVSDFVTVEGKRVGEFMHINPREHSLVLVAGSMVPGGNDGTQLNHLMMEMQFMDDVGQAYDIVAKNHYNSLFATLGRHNNDLMTSFYVHTPSGFLIECGWGGLLIDPEQWQAAELPNTLSIWGHQPMQDGKPITSPFPPPTERALAVPLQVYGDNFEAHHRPTRLSQVLKTEPLS